MGKSTTLLEPQPSPVCARVEPLSVTAGRPGNAFMTGTARPRNDLWKRAFEQLRSLSALQDDWDGLGAKAPSPALLATAGQFMEWYRASDYDPPSRVVAGTDGAVIVEWQGDGLYADLEITKPYYAECMLKMNGRGTQHWTLDYAEGWLKMKGRRIQHWTPLPSHFA
jgi:hypothetical protein